MSATRSNVLTAANVDLTDPEEVAEFCRQDVKRSGVRVRTAVKRLQELGVLDADGKRARSDTPPDMKPDSKADFGG